MTDAARLQLIVVNDLVNRVAQCKALHPGECALHIHPGELPDLMAGNFFANHVENGLFEGVPIVEDPDILPGRARVEPQ